MLGEKWGRLGEEEAEASNDGSPNPVMVRWHVQGDNSILTQGRRFIQDFSQVWRRAGATRRCYKSGAPGKLQHPSTKPQRSSKRQGNFNLQAPSRSDAGTLRVQFSVERASLGFRVDWMPSETIAWKRRNQPRQTRRPRAG